MSYRIRRRLIVWLLAPLAGLLTIGVWGIWPFGGFNGLYGTMINRLVVAQRHVPSAVTAVVFDYRGFDTMGEELMLLAAVVGVSLLLRELRDEEEAEPTEVHFGRQLLPPSQAMQAGGVFLLASGVVFGLYIALFGHLSPGGGFQGGAAVASALLLLYLIGSYEILHRLFPVHLVETVEAVAAGGYIIVALGGLVVGLRFMENFLPLGAKGHLLSGGTIPLFNTFVTIAVSAGFVLLTLEFLKQTLAVRRER